MQPSKWMAGTQANRSIKSIEECCGKMHRVLGFPKYKIIWEWKRNNANVCLHLIAPGGLHLKRLNTFTFYNATDYLFY